MAILPEVIAGSMAPSEGDRRQQNAGGMQVARGIPPPSPRAPMPLSPCGRGRDPLRQQWEGEGAADAAEMILREPPHPPRCAGPLPLPLSEGPLAPPCRGRRDE